MKTTQQMRDELLLRGRGQFKQWFGNSVVADKKGRPKPVYHSTDQQFSVFKTDGLGFHVGTKGQARDIGGSRMIKAYASLQNPLRMPDMGERWDSAVRMTDALLDQGTLTDEEGSAIMSQPRESQLQALKSLLISKGHDGIVYENEHEGRGGDSYLLFHPHQIKATTNKAPTMAPDIHMAGGGSVQRMRDELLLAGGGVVKAPVTPTGFYSPLEEAALNIQRKSGNAQAFMNDLRSVPKDQLEHAGVDRLLKSRPTITREELQQHVAQAAPKVEVLVFGEPGSTFKNMNRAQMAAAYERIIGYNPIEDDPNISDAQLRSALVGISQGDWTREEGNQPTRYSEYQLPGGENYREVLLMLPPQEPRMNYRVFAQGPVNQLPEVLDFDSREKAEAELARRRVAQPRLEHGMMEFEKLPRDGGTATFHTGHWDATNVLAHFRINDRTDKDGKKVLFVEEIQSDWGQQGKKEGFADPNKKPVSLREFNTYVYGLLDDYVARQVRAGVDPQEATRRGIHMQFPEMAQALGRADEYERMRAGRDMDASGATGVPSAPFVTKTNDWVNLALKHIMKMAAQEGHDRVAFVKGDQAADRFGLDKHFSRIDARRKPTGGYELHTTLKDGSRETSVDVPHDKLHEYVGEDLAKKIHSQGGGSFEGEGLKMPNTGIRKFYDQLVPEQAHALVKKFGGQGIKPIHLPTPPKVDPYKGLSIEPDDGQFAVTLDGHVIERHSSEAEAREGMRYIDPGFWRGEIEAGGFRRINRPPETYQGFDITPQMRQQILKPMSYKVGGAVPAMDAMRLQVWDKKTHKKDGGQVEDEYRGEHKAPGPTSGKPMHDLTDVYPEDFYGPNGFRYYADMGNDYDRNSYLITRVARGNPQQKVCIHRSIPTDVYQRAMKSASPLQQMIRPGDWVTISKEYAKEHGEGALKGDYKIASKRVPASDLYTNGDSIHEWGYHPGQRSDKE